MIKDIQELNFPSYATMSAATVSLPDMGEWNITSQIKIDGQIAPDFSFDWEVVHDGHKYIQPLRIPAGSKDNQKCPSVIDLTFQHWAIWQLKRWPFVTMQPIDSGTAVADEEVATVSLNLGDLVILFAQVLAYYFGDKITIQLNPDWQYKAEAEVITISHTKVWNVLIEIFYKQFGVRWAIEPNGGYDKYVIKIGYPTTEQSHIFEYGFEGGLMKVERQVQSEEICNLLKGRGGEKNLPYRYFKNVDPENDTFKADPDWIEELANIYFPNLMPATFRSYVQGWKAAHISKYPGYTAVGEANAYAPWAYRKGFTDTKFHPVEFVADEITINPEAGDRQVEILPGYAPFVKKGSSLDKYGPLMNSLDNNEDIYPTIQGVTVDPYGRIDEVIEVEPITSDDIEEAAENDAKISTFKQPWPSKTEKVAKVSRKVIELTGDWFTVPTGKHTNFDEGRKVIKLTKDKITYYWDFSKGLLIGKKGEEDVSLEGVVLEGSAAVELQNISGGTVSASGIPSGTYRYKVSCKIYNSTNEDLNVTVALDSPTLTDATLSDKWSGVWRIWVKNIWGTTKLASETPEQYAKRVWEPILGDRVGNEAKVVFASGMLAYEDYEFVITSIPKYDPKKCTWQTVENGQVVEHEYYSEWCIELGKSDAELDTLGVYLPSVMRQAKAGDFFLFIGIDMPHQYTVWNEIRIDDDWKKPILAEKKDIKPTWVVQTDRVRLNNEGKEDALIRLLHPGDTLRLADKRFIEGDYETLYLSSLTITYREPTSDDAALNPDVEIVLSDRYEVSANPVATLQGEVSALAKQVGSISNVEQIMRAVGDKLYLRKDGLPDRSMSPTEFASLLTSLGFRSGMVGGAGWGIYKDANGNWVIEADRFMARQDLEVNNLVINQVTGQGGTIVESAARMEITRVEDTTNGYKCYFDQHEGTVANLFHVDDIAWNNRYTPENADLKFYRRRVTEIGADYVVLTKPRNGSDRPAGWPDSGVNGVGIPAEGDVIVQRGNYTDANRQFIKVRDVIGGGYERYIEGLDSVNAEGVRYYYIGRQAGVHNGRPYFFLGDDNGYIEWVNGVLNIKGKLSISSTIGDQTFEQYIKDVVPPVTQEDIEGYVNAITKDKFDNLQSQIDGSIMTFFQHGVPTLSNYPANEWSTNDEKDKHLGDLYYDKDTGFGYRFEAKDGGGYEWVLLKDTDIAKALAAAAQAQDTADGKRRVYTSQPTPPYDKGDLWVNATYGTQYNNDILRCVTAKADGSSFAIADWTLASKYTDDSALNQFISDYEDTIEDIQGQLDGKAETWYQPTDPSATWPADKYLEHKGDLWYNTTNGTTWYWDGSQWEQQDVPDSVFDAIDGKADIFVSMPTGGYHKNDLWFLEADYTSNNGLGNPKKDYPQGTLMVATQSSTTFNAAHWAKKDRYTDDTLAQEAKDEIAGYEYIKAAIANGASLFNGGLILSGLIKLGEWDLADRENPIQTKVWAGMNGIYGVNNPRTIASWWGGDIVDRFNNSNQLISPVPANAASALVRMDGSGYLAKGNIRWNNDGSGSVAGGNITWNALGAVTIGTGVKFDVTNVNGLADTLSSLNSFVNGLNNLFVAVENDANKTEHDIAWASITANQSKLFAIKAKKGFYSDEFITAHGVNPNGGGAGGAGSFGLLYDWGNYDADAADALSAKLGYGLRESVAELGNDIASINARIDSLPTTSVNPYALTIQKNGTTLGTYDGSEAKTINISDVASASALTSHIGNATAHITANERTLWNNTATNLSAILGEDTDTIINKWEEVVAFLDTYTEADTLANLLGNKADKSTKISAGTGLTGGGTLASDRTLSLSASGVTAGTYTKLTVDAYGRATSGASLVASDIPSLPISKITGLQGALDAKLKASVFEEFKALVEDYLTFEEVNGVKRIRANYGLYSPSYITAHAVNPSGSGASGSGNFGLMREWPSADPGSGTADALGANLGWGLRTSINANTNNISLLTGRVSALESKNYLEDLDLNISGSGNAVTSLSLSADNRTLIAVKGSTFLTSASLAGYATQSWVGSQGFLTEHQSLSGYATEQWVNNKGYALASSLSNYLLSSSYTASDVLSKLKTVDGSGSGLDADLLDGYHYNRFVPKSIYNPANGVLVTTSVAKSANKMMIFRIIGHTYSTTDAPIDTIVQIYPYQGNSFTNGYSMLNNGYKLPYVKVFYADNVVKMWIPYIRDYVSYDVYCYDTMGGSGTNLVTAITASADVSASGTAALQINPKNSALTTDNVASASRLATASTYKAWGQTFFEDGVPQNVSGDLSGVGSITASGSGVFSGSLTTNSELRGMNTYVNQLFFQESASDNSLRPYMSGYQGKFNLAFRENGAWVKTPLTLDYEGNMELNGIFHSTKGIWSDKFITAHGQNTSDMRIKNRLDDVKIPLEAFANAPIFNFTFKDTGDWSQGTSAQYMEKILPSTVWDGPDGNKAFDYGRAGFIGVVTNARVTVRIGSVLLKVKKTVINHEERISELEAENKRLKQLLNIN